MLGRGSVSGVVAETVFILGLQTTEKSIADYNPTIKVKELMSSCPPPNFQDTASPDLREINIQGLQELSVCRGEEDLDMFTTVSYL